MSLYTTDYPTLSPLATCWVTYPYQLISLSLYPTLRFSSTLSSFPSFPIILCSCSFSPTRYVFISLCRLSSTPDVSCRVRFFSGVRPTILLPPPSPFRPFRPFVLRLDVSIFVHFRDLPAFTCPLSCFPITCHPSVPYTCLCRTSNPFLRPHREITSDVDRRLATVRAPQFKTAVRRGRRR